MNEKTPVDIGDLDTIEACNSGTEIELKHPTTGEKLGIFVGIVGKDSDVYREFQRKAFNRYLREEALAKKRGKDAQVRTVEDLEDDSLKLLVSCTTSWRTGDQKWMLYKKEQLEFTPENCEMVFKTRPWIRDQVNEGIGDLELFMKS